MQVTETAAAGFKREYRVVVPLTELAEKVSERLDELKGRVQLRGFRPGKVPVAHLKRLYGKSAMAEVVEAAVREANSKIVTDHGLKLATEPKVVLPTDEGAIEGVIDGKIRSRLHGRDGNRAADHAGRFQDHQGRTPAPRRSRMPRSIRRCRRSPIRTGRSPPKTARPRTAIASPCRLSAPWTAQPFDGGSGEDVPIVLGSGQFIPGFEDQLIGVKAGESRTVNVKFPENYQAAAVAGKDASFAVTVKAVEAPGAVTLDDDFAKTLGLESLAKLRDAVRERIEREHAGASRQKVKRALLDQLDAKHKFEPPPTLVEEEFNNVWSTIENDLKQQGRSFADEGTTEEKAREEYRGIAERRVRLGLVIAEIGEKNNIKVTEDQLTQAVVAQARMMPGQEQKIWDYYRNNPGALAALRAPIFEDKVVDFLLELADVTDKQVSREELFKEDEE